MQDMRSLTKASDSVKSTGDSDSSLKNGAILKGNLEFLELALVLGDLAVNIG